MAAYTFKFYDHSIDVAGQFMFGNLDAEVDIQATLLQAYIENALADDPQLTRSQIQEEVKLVKVDTETMTAVIIDSDCVFGDFTITGIIEQID